MADLSCINSPRRILSFSKKRRATVFYPDIDDRTSQFGLSGNHGPKTSEVYGFVGSKTILVATAIFFIWAYVSDPWLQAIGIHYYPSRYWALAVPTYLMVAIVLALGFYVGLNFMATLSPTSIYTVLDEKSQEPVRFVPSVEGDEPPIDPMFDIGLHQINQSMFNDEN